MAREFGPVLGSRRLSILPTRRPVTVTLGKPRKSRRHPRIDWECPYRITGLRVRGVQYGYGMDALSALTNALTGIRVMLERSPRRVSWFDIGETGFELAFGFGAAFNKRLTRVIEREFAAHVRVLERQSRSREAARRRRSR